MQEKLSKMVDQQQEKIREMIEQLDSKNQLLNDKDIENNMIRQNYDNLKNKYEHLCREYQKLSESFIAL